MVLKLDYKSLMLVVLVITSIILSYKIWFEEPYTAGGALKNIEINDSDVRAIVRPEMIYANYGGPFHSLMVGDRYDRFWSEFINILREYRDLKNKNPIKSINKTEWIKAISQRSIMYIFASDIRYELFSKLFGFKLDTPPKYIKDIVITSGENPMMYIKDSASDSYYQVDLGYITTNVNQLINSAEKFSAANYSTSYELGFNSKIRSDVLIPVDTDGFLYWSIKLLGGYERDIQRRFFTDLSVVRKVQERSGTVAYTDGKKGLRIYPYGKLEYNDSSMGYRNVDMVTAVKMAIQFIKEHGGIDQGIYFKSIIESKKDQRVDYQVAFGYDYKGIPILMPEGDYINVSISYDNIQEYSRWLKVAEAVRQETGIINAIKAIDVLYQHIPDAGYISDIELAYYDTGNFSDSRCRLVWKIVSGNRTYFVDAKDARWMGE